MAVRCSITQIGVLLLLLFSFSCEKDDPDPKDPEPVPPKACNYTQWAGSSNGCQAGNYAVSNTKCCPDGFPFWFEGGGGCYKTCEEANSKANGKVIYRYNDGVAAPNNPSKRQVVFYSNDCGNMENIEIYLNNLYQGYFKGCSNTVQACDYYMGAMVINIMENTNYSWYTMIEGKKGFTGTIFIPSTSLTTCLAVRCR